MFSSVSPFKYLFWWGRGWYLRYPDGFLRKDIPWSFVNEGLWNDASNCLWYYKHLQKTCFQAYWIILKYFLNHRLPSICNTQRRGSRWCLGHFAEMSHQGPAKRTHFSTQHLTSLLHATCSSQVLSQVYCAYTLNFLNVS